MSRRHVGKVRSKNCRVELVGVLDSVVQKRCDSAERCVREMIVRTVTSGIPEVIGYTRHVTFIVVNVHGGDVYKVPLLFLGSSLVSRMLLLHFHRRSS